VSSVATEPSAEPLSTTTISGAPALSSASSERTQSSSNDPDSKFTTTAAQRGTDASSIPD
jgi:hypothetical protein